MKLRVLVKRPFGDVEVEGESLDELIEGLQVLPDWLLVIDRLVMGSEIPPGPAELLTGVVELSEDGPLVTAPKERISDKEAIGLILYAKGVEALEPREIGRFLELSGRPSTGFGARLSEMKREGLVVKEGNAYRLSAAGRNWVEDTASRLKGG
mgnify:CR=1 FL=1